MSYFQKKKKRKKSLIFIIFAYQNGLASSSFEPQPPPANPIYGYAKPICYCRSPPDWFKPHIYNIEIHARMSTQLYIVLNPIRVLRGLTIGLMRAGFASPHYLTKYIATNQRPSVSYAHYSQLWSKSFFPFQSRQTILVIKKLINVSLRNQLIQSLVA